MAGVGADWADITIGGITLRAYVPESSVEPLGRHGERVKLFTSLQAREDSLTLYGFPSSDARSTFESLILVNGVGPRLALSILSSMSTESLAVAIAAGDTDAFKGIHGVGAKTANRIVLELKGKLEVEPSAVPAGYAAGDLVDALTAIGYTLPEAMSAAAALPADEELSLEEKVRLSLQQRGGA